MVEPKEPALTRKTVIVLISFAALLGALLIWRAAPRDGSPPPERPPDRSAMDLPGPKDGTGDRPPGEGDGSRDGEVLIVRGQVVTGEGSETPVPGAQVLVFEDPFDGDIDIRLPSKDAPDPVPAVAGAVTGEDGTFTVRLPPLSGTLRFVARAQGYQEGFDEILNAGEEVWIDLQKEPSQSWRVEDLAERPVAGAEVLVYGSRVDGLPIGRLLTDDRGRIPAAAGEGGHVLIRKPGYAVTDCDLSDPEPHVVVLWPAFALAGVVSDAQGLPVRDAGMDLFAGEWRTRCVTSADGRFHFDGLGELQCPQLKVTATGFLPREWISCSPGREDVTIVLRRPEELPPTGSLPVKEVLPDGVVASRTRFTVVRLPDRESSYYDLDESRTAGEGVTVLTGLPPGEYELFSEYGVAEQIPLQSIEKTIPRYRATATARIEAGVEAPLVTLRLEDIGHSYACIRVVDANGRPAESVRLHCETPGLGRFTKNHHWYTSPSGKIVTAVEAPPGTTVTYTAYPYASIEGVPVTAGVKSVADPAGPFTDLALRAGARVVIRVRDTSGEPLPREVGLRVEVAQDGFPEWRDGFLQIYSGPGSPGPFVVSLLPDRPYSLRVQSFNHTARLVSFEAPGEGSRDVEVILSDGARLSGKLLTPRGAPPGTLDIQVLDESGRDVVDIPMYFLDGRFFLSALPAGRLVFLAESRERRLVAVMPVKLAVGEDRDLGEVRMRPMARIRGTVLGVDGRPAGGVELLLREADEYSSRARTVTRRDGSFELPSLYCIRPVIVVRPPDGAARALIEIPDKGVSAKIKVQLEAAAEVFARFDPPVRVRLSEPSLRVDTPAGIRCYPRALESRTEDHRLEGYRIMGLPAGEYILRFEGRLESGPAVSAIAFVSVKPGDKTETILR